MARNLYIAVSTVALVLGLSLVAAAQERIRVEVNGEPVVFSGMGPQRVQGRVLVPLRGVLEKLGAFVGWEPATQTVIASKGDLDLQLRIGSRIALVNGREVTLDVPAASMAGSTMVPLRFVGETLGADVRWDAPTSTVMIASRGGVVGQPDRPVPDRDPIVTRPDNRPPPIQRPLIDRITLEGASGWMRAGERLTIRMRGTPGGEASFRIPGVAEGVRMREVSPGVYEQDWTVPADSALNVAEAPILGILQARGSDARDASVVQGSGVLQIDNTPPSISDVNPAPRSEVTRPRPLISATFTDQGGSGVDTSKVRILVDGRDVTMDAAVTPQFFSYTPQRGLEGSSHRVEVTVQDRAGNSARQAWDFVTPAAQAVKGIEEIQTNAHGTLNPGTVLNFRVKGIPGGRASWSMGGRKDIPLKESTPGIYVGSWRIRDNDDFDKAHLNVALTAPGGRKYTESYAQPLTVNVSAPEAPKITFPGANDRLTDPLVIRGTGTPNSTVRLKIDYTEKVLGILGVKGTAGQVEVPVSADGKWETKPLSLGSILRSRDTQVTLIATAVNSRQQESPVTTLRIR